jgi:hypothetical protein
MKQYLALALEQQYVRMYSRGASPVMKAAPHHTFYSSIYILASRNWYWYTTGGGRKLQQLYSSYQELRDYCTMHYSGCVSASILCEIVYNFQWDKTGTPGGARRGEGGAGRSFTYPLSSDKGV